MKLRQAILWQPTTAGRLGVLGAALVLVVLVAYLHLITGIAYEFYVFFGPVVAVVAWFVGQRAGYGVAVAAVASWLLADGVLVNSRADFAPAIFNSVSRLVVFCAGVRLIAQLHLVLDRERRLARHDALTQLPNRREFYERGQRALGQAQREASPITAVFIDLDKFKQVNDEQGHATGDALLVCVAEVLGARLRSSDIAARLGGDEFALLLPGMGRATSRVYIDDLRRRLLKAMADRRWPVTFSIGVASYERAPVDLDVLLAAADGLMYEVKNGGRDRILQRELRSS